MMTPPSFTFFATATVCWAVVAAAMIPGIVLAVEMGETYCIEGYVMDYYCINDGFLLDNPSVITLEGPDLHTIHCLVDVEACVTSPFEILTEPTSETTTTTYGRGWRVTDASRDILVDLARTVGDRCSTCFGMGMQTQGFRAVMNATVITAATGDGTPPVVEVHAAFPTSVIDAGGDESARRTVRLAETDDPCLEYFNMPEGSSSMDGGSMPATPSDPPVEIPMDTPTEIPADSPMDSPTDSPTDSPMDVPTNEETDPNIPTANDETDPNIPADLPAAADETASSAGSQLHHHMGVGSTAFLLAWGMFSRVF